MRRWRPGYNHVLMKITQDLRVEAEWMAGMEAKSEEFAEHGEQLYVPQPAAE
jgi:phosphomethylpyrimidine synthase